MKNRMLVSMTALAACLVCASCLRTPPAGTLKECIVVGDLDRTYLVHVPTGFDGKTRLPLVVALHPFTGTGKAMERMTGFSSLADREGFLVAYPDGHQRVWNADPAAPSSILGPPADDVAFVSALIGHLLDAYNADPDRVYVTGASSGGLMTHRVACELTDKLAAAASVMITLPVGWKDYEKPAGPLPFLIIQGVADPFFPWQGGMVNEGPSRKREYQSVEETVAFWVDNNNAVSPPTKTDLPDTNPNDGTTVFWDAYAANPEGAEVDLYGINGGGHTWPGGAGTCLEFLVGRIGQDMDAAQVVWNFFKTHIRSG
jgi:polyhydroxybutyrate depolymerase